MNAKEALINLIRQFYCVTQSDAIYYSTYALIYEFFGEENANKFADLSEELYNRFRIRKDKFGQFNQWIKELSDE